MRFTNRPLLSCLLASLFLTGCATTSSNKETIPEWVGDRVESDAPMSDTEPNDFDSPADANSLFGFLSTKYLDENKKDDQPILAIDPNKAKEETPPPSVETPEETSTTPTAELPIGSTPKTTETLTPEVAKTPLQSTTAKGNQSKTVPDVTNEPPPIPKPKALRAKNAEHEAQARAGRSEYFVALAEMKSGNLEGALSIFKTLSTLYPLLSGPVVNQGIILRKQGKLKDAKKILQDALFKKYQNPYLLSELGAINRDLGNFKQAKQAYLSAIRIEGAYANAHYNLGVLADLYLHDPELALKEFKAYQALQEKPNKKVKGWIKELARRIKRMKKPIS
jgi:tetratricopeptide (TPR) repeat protein